MDGSDSDSEMRPAARGGRGKDTSLRIVRELLVDYWSIDQVLEGQKQSDIEATAQTIRIVYIS